MLVTVWKELDLCIEWLKATYTFYYYQIIIDMEAGKMKGNVPHLNQASCHEDIWESRSIFECKSGIWSLVC